MCQECSKFFTWINFVTMILSIVAVHSLSHLQLLATPWTVAHQTSLSFTISWSFLKLMSIESVMPSNHLMLCCSLLLPSIFPSINLFQRVGFFTSGGQSTGASVSLSVQFSSVQLLSCVRLFVTPWNYSLPALPVHHQLPEYNQTRVHRVSDAIQSSHPLSSPSPPAPNPSQHQGLFQ